MYNVNNWLNLSKNKLIGNSIFLPININGKIHSFVYYFSCLFDSILQDNRIGVRLEGKISSIVSFYPNFFLNYDGNKDNSVLQELLLCPFDIVKDNSLLNKHLEVIYNLFYSSLVQIKNKYTNTYNDILENFYDEYLINYDDLLSISSDESISYDSDRERTTHIKVNDLIDITINNHDINNFSFTIKPSPERLKKYSQIINLNDEEILKIKQYIDNKYYKLYKSISENNIFIKDINLLYNDILNEFQKYQNNDIDITDITEKLERYCEYKYGWNWYSNLNVWNELINSDFKELIYYPTDDLSSFSCNFKHIIFGYILHDIKKDDLKQFISNSLINFPFFFLCNPIQFLNISELYMNNNCLQYTINSVNELFNCDVNYTTYYMNEITDIYRDVINSIEFDLKPIFLNLISDVDSVYYSSSPEKKSPQKIVVETVEDKENYDSDQRSKICIKYVDTIPSPKRGGETFVNTDQPNRLKMIMNSVDVGSVENCDVGVVDVDDDVDVIKNCDVGVVNVIKNCDVENYVGVGNVDDDVLVKNCDVENYNADNTKVENINECDFDSVELIKNSEKNKIVQTKLIYFVIIISIITSILLYKKINE